MGLQDREYLHEPYDDYGYRKRHRGGAWSMTIKIVILNIVLFFVNGLLFPDNFLSRAMQVHVFTLWTPWLWWEFLTYGFAHSPSSAYHIGGNMLCLLMFARGYSIAFGPNGTGIVRSDNIEDQLGPWEFLVFYLSTIIIGGITYAVVNFYSLGASHAEWNTLLRQTPWYELGGCWGASGGVTGIVILYALFFPNRMGLLIVFPVPMWLMGAAIVVMDAMGASGYSSQGIAYSVHLAGAAFASFYYFVLLKNGKTLTGGFRGLGFSKMFPKRKPKLKVYHDETSKPTDSTEEEFQRRLDEILVRHGKVGFDGLTPEEQEFLKKASKKYKNKQ